MTKHELEQLRYVSKEIRLLEEQIDNIKVDIVSDTVKGSDVNFPYTYHSIFIQGIDQGSHNKKIRSLKRDLMERKTNLINLVCDINKYISSIEDSEIRQIIILKYINGLTWSNIATHLHYADESVPRKKIDRFVK